MRRREVAVLGGVIAAMFLAGIATVWAAWTSTSAGSAEAKAAADLRGPAATAATTRNNYGGLGYVRPGDAFTVYANVSDAGSPPSGVASVTADVSSFSGGGSAVALPACTTGCTVGSVAYSHKSSPQIASSIAEGTYAYSITATDNVGIAKTTTGFSVVIDNTNPAVTLASPAHGSTIDQTTPTFAGTAGTAAGDRTTIVVGIYAGSGVVESNLVQSVVTTASGGSWSAPAGAALSPGTYTARASQDDAAGNYGTSSANVFTIDVAPPALSSLETYDADADGKIDQIKATFSETVTCAAPCTAPWSFTGLPAGASLQAVSGGGSATLTLTLAEPDDDETAFAGVQVSLAADAVLDAAGNDVSFTDATPADKALPVRVRLEMLDTGTPNGKVDAVVATYSETVTCTCSGAAGWTFSGSVPSGGTRGAVSASGSAVTVAVVEGSGAADTAVGTFKAAYAAGAGNVVDASGNLAVGVAATSPADKAKPLPLDLTMSDADGKPEENDVITITYTERLSTASMCAGKWPATGTTDATAQTLSGTAGGVQIAVKNNSLDGNDEITIAASSCTGGFQLGTLSLGSPAYVGGDTTFGTSGANLSTIAWDGTSKLTLTLGRIVSGGSQCTSGCPSAATPIVFTPDADVKDPSNNVATGSLSKNARL